MVCERRKHTAEAISTLFEMARLWLAASRNTSDDKAESNTFHQCNMRERGGGWKQPESAAVAASWTGAFYSFFRPSTNCFIRYWASFIYDDRLFTISRFVRFVLDFTSNTGGVLLVPWPGQEDRQGPHEALRVPHHQGHQVDRHAVDEERRVFREGMAVLRPLRDALCVSKPRHICCCLNIYCTDIYCIYIERALLL